MSRSECPCYTCLVSACCPGKWPTPKQWDEIDKECIKWEKENPNEIFEELIEDEKFELTMEESCAEEKAHDNCCYFQDWLEEVKKIKIGEDVWNI